MNVTTKLLIALPAIALVSACNSSPRVHHNTTSMPSYEPQTMTPISYSCGNAGNITVDYNNSSVTRLGASFPELQLTNQRINLYREVSGSGELYVDNLNPDSTIMWHTKGDEALFAVEWANGKDYQATCKQI